MLKGILKEKVAHVVVLGAGASCAAIANGDRNGKFISAMNGFIENSGLSSVIENLSLETTSNNLEDIYSEVYDRATSEKEFALAKNKLEEGIRGYISSFEIPTQLTVYDFLLRSLQPKDHILTFNWDPLLLQAYGRIHPQIVHHLPQIHFLHGNVNIGFCEEDNFVGNLGNTCKICGKQYSQIPLLYPVRNKNYKDVVYIRKAWEMAQQALVGSCRITFFGYSMPDSDVEAVAMLKSSWKNAFFSEYGEIEIIDLPTQHECLRDKIIDFSPEARISLCENFFESSLAKYPRRTTEILYKEAMECKFIKPTNPFYEGMDKVELEKVTHGLILEEEGKI